MNHKSTLTRKSDGKKFKVTFLSFWSDIESDDGEKDTIKWLWGGCGNDITEYISCKKGNTYILDK